MFAEFDPEPLAAASIAQVHAARLRSGAPVVVKVQRPGIRPVVERDLDIVFTLARTIEARSRLGSSPQGTVQTPMRRGLNIVELADGFATALGEELDFRVEARNMRAVLAAATQRPPGPSIRLPALHETLSSERVLVLERLDGIPLGAAWSTIDERGLDRTALAQALFRCLLGQIMLDGVFHADPHPGNILLLDDGRLGLIDFGSVGRLDALLRTALGHLLLAIDRSDPAGLSDALLEVVQRPDEIDERDLVRALGQFMALHLGPGVVPGIEMFTDLFRLVSAYGLAIPPEIAGVFRSLGTLEGTLAKLAPGFDIVAEARTFATAQLTSQLRPDSLYEAATRELLQLVPVLRRLPRRVDHITGALEQGRFSVNVRLFADQRDRRVVTTLLHQVLLAFLGATTGVIGVMLLGTKSGSSATSSVSLFGVLGYTLLVISFVLILRILFIIFRPESEDRGAAAPGARSRHR